MGGVAVIGEQVAVQGFGLAGALVLAAEDDAQARAAWRRLPAGTAVVILTRGAARALRYPEHAPAWPLVVVMP